MVYLCTTADLYYFDIYPEILWDKKNPWIQHLLTSFETSRILEKKPYHVTNSPTPNSPSLCFISLVAGRWLGFLDLWQKVCIYNVTVFQFSLPF